MLKLGRLPPPPLPPLHSPGHQLASSDLYRSALPTCVSLRAFLPSTTSNIHMSPLSLSLCPGRPVPRSDHGLPSSAPALLGPTLLRTLQTPQPGSLPGRPGGRRTHTRTQMSHTAALRPRRSAVLLSHLSHTCAGRPVSNNSCSCASYILT